MLRTDSYKPAAGNVGTDASVAAQLARGLPLACDDVYCAVRPASMTCSVALM